MHNKIKQGRFSIVFFAILFIFINFNIAVVKLHAAEQQPKIEQCLQDKIVQADNTMTVGEIRLLCQKIVNDAGAKTTESNLERRQQFQSVAWENPFVLSVHKPNYVLILAKNSETNEAPFEKQYPNEDTNLDNTEAKFQISVKFPIALDLFERNDDIFFAYTNRSFWQLYRTTSGPFRETNHEPELFYSLKTNWNIFGLKNKMVNMGYVHQSNGRGGTLSRSWNRLYALFVLEKNNWVFGFKPWYRISENIEDDDNPDIEDFMGNFELTGIYTKGHHTFSAMLRNNLKSTDNRGAIQIDWVFPLDRYINGYVQYFSGYGESMIDYNYDQESIGIGLALTGWL
ncbi:MAG: phospholipase A [Gammaproteobacteria bacterium]